MPIEEIAAGDMVFGEDPETGEQGYFEVVSVRSHVKAELVQVTISAETTSDDEPTNESRDDETDDTPPQTEVMTTTPEHPVYVEGKGWMWAENLELGDRLRQADGGMAKVLALERIQLDKPEQVYNFTVKGPHTYFVLEVGVLVHNDGELGCLDGPELERQQRLQQRREALGKAREINQQSGFGKLVEEENKVRSRIRFEQGDREEFLIHFTDENSYNNIRQIIDGEERFILKPSPQEGWPGTLGYAPKGAFFIDARPYRGFMGNVPIDPKFRQIRGDLSGITNPEYDPVALATFIPKLGNNNKVPTHFIIMTPLKKQVLKKT